MTEKAIQVAQDRNQLSMASLLDASLRPGGSISLAFSDGIINVTLDQLGDWTIIAGLSLRSDRLLPVFRSLEKLGFFRASENEGMVYLLWTSALQDKPGDRTIAEKTLLGALKSLQVSAIPSYIG